MTNEKIKQEPKTAAYKKRKVFYSSTKVSPRGFIVDQGTISEEDIMRRSLASGLSK